MATERPLPVPPASPPKFSFPAPLKQDPNLKPNPHPYAIRTTTSALLTRSNSTSSNVDTTRHFYVPLSPNANRSPESSKGHKLSKSVNNLDESPTRSPRPLPVPPGFPSPAASPSNGSGGPTGADDRTHLYRRTKRADTLPTFPLADSHPTITPPEDLPSNPKLWTPSQLSTYLVTALRMTSQPKSGEAEPITLPTRVAKDIAAFSRARMINGRAFLKLTESDLESMGMNKKWRQALLVASHNLRQNMLKGRIWGPELSTISSPEIVAPLPVHPFSSSLYNSSSSSLESIEESEQAPAAPSTKRYRQGRVRGMVETFERSGSFSSEASVDGEEAVERVQLGRWLRAEGAIDDQPIRSPSPVGRMPVPEAPAEENYHKDVEPTMEELLAESAATKGLPSTGPWGARAWEEMDFAPGVTVKRIPEVEPSTDADVTETHKMLLGPFGPGSGKRSRGRGEKDERRVVTAIFAPTSPPDKTNPLERSGDGSTEIAEHCEHGAQTDADSQPVDEPSEEDVRWLEQELQDTRNLIDAFRRRLQAIEEKVAESERLEQEREVTPESMHPPTHEASDIVRSSLVPEREAGNASPREDFLKVIPGAPAESTLSLPVTLQRLTGISLPGSYDTQENGEDDDDPSSLTDLPSYVLLVGFGVCAVILRVVLKRLVGRSAVGAWKS